MNLNSINKQLQDEKARHQRVIDNLAKDKCKENERHQRNLSYLNSLKQNWPKNEDVDFKKVNDEFNYT